MYQSSSIRQCYKVTAVLFFLLLQGCCFFAPCPYLTADKLAENGGFKKDILNAGLFAIVTYSRIDSPGAPLTFYIEGDGAAWTTRRLLSADPTPRHPLALKLALSDPGQNIVYLARPCQYVLKNGMGTNCNSRYWSSAIFSEEVIGSVNLAMSKLKKQSSASGIHLIGYSGGGAVAVLIASRRNDIVSIRTVAGNLDHEKISLLHGVTPLTESLNAIDVAEKIKTIPQIHFSGSRDKIVPEAIAIDFVARQKGPACSRTVLVEGAEHGNGWLEKWPSLLQIPLPCYSEP
jgi:pimeloyl-ACP methyl ester carboxylesterase